MFSARKKLVDYQKRVKKEKKLCALPFFGTEH